MPFSINYRFGELLQASCFETGWHTTDSTVNRKNILLADRVTIAFRNMICFQSTAALEGVNKILGNFICLFLLC